jgi:hypothetical protein
MCTRRLALGLLLLLCASGCGSKPTENEVTSGPGKFTIRFPSTPQEEETSMPGLGIKAQGFILKRKEGTLQASSAEVPADSAILQDPEKELDFMVKDNPEKNKAKLAGSEMLTLDGAPGREYRMEMPDGKTVVRSRIFFKDKRLYAITAVGSKDFVNSSDADTFFKSFKFVK